MMRSRRQETHNLRVSGSHNRFEVNSVTDAILHIRCTARDGGKALRDEAIDNLKTHTADAAAAGMVRLFSVQHEFPSEWATFKSVKLSVRTAAAWAIHALPQPTQSTLLSLQTSLMDGHKGLGIREHTSLADMLFPAAALPGGT